MLTCYWHEEPGAWPGETRERSCGLAWGAMWPSESVGVDGARVAVSDTHPPVQARVTLPLDTTACGQMPKRARERASLLIYVLLIQISNP